MTPPTLREICTKCAQGPYFISHDDKDMNEDYYAHVRSGLAVVDTGRSGDWPVGRFMEWPNAQLIARCDPQTMLAVVNALTLADLNYSRTNHSQPDMMGDDEHEAWGAIKSALAALNRTP